MAKEQKPRSMERRGKFPARELIVVAKREAELRVTHEGIASPKGADTTPLTELLSSEGAALRPLFGVNEGRLRDEAVSKNAPTSEEVPDLAVYYKVEAPDERLDSLAAGVASGSERRLPQARACGVGLNKKFGEVPRWRPNLESMRSFWKIQSTVRQRSVGKKGIISELMTLAGMLSNGSKIVRI